MPVSRACRDVTTPIPRACDHPVPEPASSACCATTTASSSVRQRTEVLHGAPQQPGVAHRVPVVGEDPDPGLPQLVEMRQCLTPPPEGDATCRHHLGQPAVRSPLRYVAGEVPAVDRGVGVGHRHQGGEPPGGGGGRTRGDVLLPLLTRLAEMGVQVDQSGTYPAPGDVDGVSRRRSRTQRPLTWVPVTSDVGGDGALWPKDRSPFQHQVSHCCPPATGRAPPSAPPPRSQPGGGSASAGRPPPPGRVRSRG